LRTVDKCPRIGARLFDMFLLTGICALMYKCEQITITTATIIAGGTDGHPEEIITVRNDMKRFMINITVNIAICPKLPSIVAQSCENLVMILDIGTVSSQLIK
jgi:hypothetical protein